VETQPITDDPLPTRELAVDAGSFVIAAVAPPSHSPFHKGWVSSLPDRHTLKRNRDYDQARAVAQVAERYLNFDNRPRDC
jgi:Nucleotidyltransferase